jgi:hypothetical protein
VYSYSKRRQPMAVFEIEQYKVHSQRYWVEAASEAEAIKKVHPGFSWVW